MTRISLVTTTVTTKSVTTGGYLKIQDSFASSRSVPVFVSTVDNRLASSDFGCNTNFTQDTPNRSLTVHYLVEHL